MLAIITFLFPSLVSLKMDLQFSDKKYSIVNLVINCGIFCIINNIITLILWIYIIKNKNTLTDIITFSGLMVKYLLLSLIIAILTSIVKIIIVKNVEAYVETKNNNSN